MAGGGRCLPKPSSWNAHLLALCGGLLLVAAVGLMTWFEFTSTREARFWVEHTYDDVHTVDEVALALRDAETGQRGYLLTHDDSYLVPYNDARDRVALLQGDLRRLTADNPVQQDHLRALAPLVERKMDELARTIQLLRDSGPEAALALMRTSVGERLTEQIQAALASITAEEDRLLALRKVASNTAEARARALALATTLLAMALLAVSVWLLARERARLAGSEGGQRLLAEQMRTAFDSVSQGIGVFDPDGRLTRWNRCFNVILGVPAPMMRQGTPYEAIAEQAADVAKGPFLETEDQIRHGPGGRAQNEPIVYERTRASDDRSFELRRTTTPDGGLVLTLTDITERVRSEKTARDSQRLQAMGQLTGGIAHDFNNLLTVILGNLERLAFKLGDGAAGLPQIERALWATKRAAALTQQLLAFARQQPLAPIPIDLSAMLPDMTHLLQRTLGEHIDLRVVDTAGLWPAVADPSQVESAVLNLALNARDAMPDGGRLTIELANKVLDAEYARQHIEVSAGEYVMVAVSDTGTGMPPEVLARAFEPFFTTKEPDKGTGLGLAMVYGFAKQSGGHVKIYSEAGQGTTVRLYLPRAIGAAVPAMQRSTAPIDLPHGSATVLVVEDEPAVREVTVQILRDLGYRVLEAGNGEEALRVFGDNHAAVDVLLVDVVLSGSIKGHETARRLQDIRRDLRVLFMSGYTENAIVHHGRLDDGVHLIGKPFSREALARRVAEVLGRSGTSSNMSEDGKIVDIKSRDRSH